MWKSLSIGSKIWLVMSLLVAGYLTTMVIGFWGGKQTEQQLNNITEYIFPATKSSQTALTAFNEQIKLYNDAIMLGDESLISAAGKKSLEAVKSLARIAGMPGITVRKKHEISELSENIKRFTEKANPIYAAMSKDSDEENDASDIEVTMSNLSDSTKSLRHALQFLMNSFSNGLKANLISVIRVAKHQQLVNISIFFCVVICTLCMISVIISRSISRPLKNTVTVLKSSAEGDLTKRLEVNSKDEVGEMAKWFNIFIENLQGIIKDFQESTETLNSSAGVLNNLSSLMSGSTKDMDENSNTVAQATDEMSTNMNSVAISTTQASKSMSFIATAIEEMISTISDITQNSEKAKGITNEAVSQARESSVKIGALNDAAMEISRVTEVITGISEQTNLLALNATIEAARAGEAGKGFSVVANEIKVLARQTAEATQDIRSKIESIQQSTNMTVSEMGQITTVINDVNEIVTTIATAVEQQKGTTTEISGNITEASKGINEVSENIAQSSSMAENIAQDIHEVSKAVGEVSNNSCQVNMNAADLSKLSEQIKEMVIKFRI